MKAPILVLAVAVALPQAALVRAADNRSEMEPVVVRTTDFRGKPPFRRKVERLAPAEFARFEADEAARGELIRERATDFRGRPPFARNVERIETAEMARLERINEEVDEDRKVRRRGPFAGRLPHGIGTR